MASAAELAYCAGVVDSDGYILVARRRDRPKNERSFVLYFEMVGVGQVTREAVDLLQSLFGGSVSARKKKKKSHHTLYIWRVQQIQANQAIKALLPYLRIKKDQAFNALAFRPALDDCKVANRTVLGKKGRQPRSEAFTRLLDFHYLRSRWLNTHVDDRGDGPEKPPPPVVENRHRGDVGKKMSSRLGRRVKPSEIREIRAFHRRGGFSYQDVADKFGFSIGTAWNIVNKRTYAGVD